MWTVYLKTTETIIQLSDKEDDIEPVIIEDDIPMKTTNPIQRVGNSIKEYLRRQQQRNKSES